MNRKAVYGLLLALLLPFAGYFIIKNLGEKATAMPRRYIYDSTTDKVVNGKQVTDTIWHRMPDFHLTNQVGKKVSLADVTGKILVINFFFTHCPTICPQLTANIKRMHDGIKNSELAGPRDPDFVQFLSLSIDPERDSVQELKKWADRFAINPGNWWLLTGPKKEIYNLSIDDLKIGVVDGKHVDSNFIHTDYIVLLDKNRNIRGYYHGLDTSTISQLSHDIIFLTLEKDPKKKGPFAGQLELVAIVFLIAIIGMFVLLALLKKENQQVA